MDREEMHIVIRTAAVVLSRTRDVSSGRASTAKAIANLPVLTTSAHTIHRATVETSHQWVSNMDISPQTFERRTHPIGQQFPSLQVSSPAGQDCLVTNNPRMDLALTWFPA